jgi:hypothetical protein
MWGGSDMGQTMVKPWSNQVGVFCTFYVQQSLKQEAPIAGVYTSSTPSPFLWFHRGIPVGVCCTRPLPAPPQGCPPMLQSMGASTCVSH